MVLAYGMVIGASIVVCICAVFACTIYVELDEDSTSTPHMSLLGAFLALCGPPTAIVTIAMAATTLGLGLGGVGGTKAAGIMIIGGAVTLSAACVCCGLAMYKLKFMCDCCSGFCDCCSGFCSLIAGLLCYPRTLWRRRQELRRRRELEALEGGTAAGPATARAADPTCIAVELEPQPPGEVTTKEPDPPQQLAWRLRAA